jgi:hypothetical protein
MFKKYDSFGEIYRSLLDIWHNGADELPAYLTAQNFVAHSSQTRMLS